MKDGAIANGVACLTYNVLTATSCSDAAEWEYKEKRIRNIPLGACLKRTTGGEVLLQTCDNNDKVESRL